ncbi:uncharacterized protein ASPGLDRAFT_1002027 [Aspergillus glaucus CBS 516.65]|uniref:Uncharacterized protein n=1 Tax=Aspergillus glaucus CBS 516.65 TaxID=1160497 RepID=A0A1L9VVD0_ASPGL|nr:hypothetical protein ASPGLDRAFT_1002027 [Aspergillus glaucus CBS 516.65]OJJ87873.1 hypothetical protein ASPGLDRAFT_1002027 [Aspergillus glaucus CBS 516.65]
MGHTLLIYHDIDTGWGNRANLLAFVLIQPQLRWVVLFSYLCFYFLDNILTAWHGYHIPPLTTSTGIALQGGMRNVWKGVHAQRTFSTIRRDPLARQDENSGGHIRIRFSGWPRIMGDTYLRLIPLFFIFAIFYFLIILFIPPSMFVMSSLLGLFGLLSTFMFLLALVI